MQLFAPTTLFGMSSAPLMVHWTQARAKIRLGAIVPLFLLAVAFVSLPLLHSQWPNGRLPDHHGALEGTLPFSKLDDLCTIDEWQRGSWTLRPPDELQRLASAETYAAFLELQQFRCHWAVPEYSCNGDEALPRVQQAAQWSWQVGGCRLAPLDPSTIVRHLLEHGGWFFVGESTSRQQVVTLQCLLGEHLEMSTSPRNPSNGDANALEYVFSAASPLASEYPGAVGRPLLLFWWSIFLLSGATLDRLVEDAVQLRLPLESLADEPRWQWSNWDVGEAIDLVLQNSQDSMFSLLVLNTGAYWNRFQFHADLDYDRMAAIQAGLIEQVGRQLARLPPSFQTVYRSAHYFNEHCRDADSPSSVELAPPSGTMWNDIAHLQAAWGSGQTPYTYLNITGPTYLRPDAHFNPPKDCLHFCQASGVVENWSSILWTEVVRHNELK